MQISDNPAGWLATAPKMQEVNLTLLICVCWWQEFKDPPRQSHINRRKSKVQSKRGTRGTFLQYKYNKTELSGPAQTPRIPPPGGFLFSAPTPPNRRPTGRTRANCRRTWSNLAGYPSQVLGGPLHGPGLMLGGLAIIPIIPNGYALPPGRDRLPCLPVANK